MASMQDVQSLVGYTDLLAMPADGRRYEIHGGELVVVPSPLPRHQFAVQAVFLLLHEHARTSGGVALAAPLDVVFDEYDVLQPDVLFFRAERRHLIRPDAVTRHAPDVAVEVLSPSTAAADRGRKMRTFARYGVPECWIVDPALERIEIHVLDAGACRLHRPRRPVTVRPVLLAGLTFDAARVFPGSVGTSGDRSVRGAQRSESGSRPARRRFGLYSPAMLPAVARHAARLNVLRLGG